MKSEIAMRSKKKKRSRLRILSWMVFSLFVAAFVLANGIGLYLGNIVYEEVNIAYVRTHQSEDAKKEKRLMRGMEQRSWENVEITSPFGYAMKGTFVPNAQKTEQTVLFLHGFTQNRLAGLDYLPMYLQMGFNVLLVDLRAHGESGGTSVTWGACEKKDVDVWLDWLATRVPGGIVGIHGISMGAATALLHAEMHEVDARAAFYIADSAYADLKPLLKKEIRAKLGLAEQSVLPDILLGYGDLVCWAKDRFTFAASSPAEAAKHISAPVLYVHGEKDPLVPVQMVRTLYDNTPGQKELSLFPQAAHAMAFYEDRRQYERVVKQFIETALEK